MSDFSVERCSQCDYVVSNGKHWCVCVLCKVPVHRACCGGNVAGGSGAGDDVETVTPTAAVSTGRPKRAVKRPVIFDPSNPIYIRATKLRTIDVVPAVLVVPVVPVVPVLSVVSAVQQEPTSPTRPRLSPLVEYSTNNSLRPISPLPKSSPDNASRRSVSPLASLIPPILLTSILRSPPPIPPPRRKRRVQQPNPTAVKEEKVAPTASSLSPVPRRDYEVDGVRPVPPVEPIETAVSQQSSFVAPTEPNYQIHVDGSNKGKIKLTNGLGYSYTKKRESGKTFTWRCSYRPSKNPCKATISQVLRVGRESYSNYDQQDFKESLHNPSSGIHHNHPPDYGNHLRVPLFKKAKEEAVTEKLKQPKRIVLEEIKKIPEMSARDMPNIENATRRLRYTRSKILAEDPRRDHPVQQFRL